MKAVLFDLDGVLRFFDAPLEVELSFDSVAAVAFEPRRLHRLVTGGLSKASWIDEAVGELGEGARVWLDRPGRIDAEAWAYAQSLRATHRIGILTNGTDVTRAELAGLGVLDRLDAFVCSAEIGVAKPDPEAFLAGCAALEASPRDVCFVDDSAANVAAAGGVGLWAHRFVGVPALKRTLADRLETAS